MPTSIAHSIGGYAALEAAGQESRLRRPVFWLLVLVLANLPDLDFLPGLLVGDPELLHRGASHSLFSGVVAAALLAPLLARWVGGAGRAFWLVLLVYSSHVLLDLVATAPPEARGMQLFWPLSAREYLVRTPLLTDLPHLRSFYRAPGPLGFFDSLFSWTGLRIFVLDAIFVLPVLLLEKGARRLWDTFGPSRGTGEWVTPPVEVTGD